MQVTHVLLATGVWLVIWRASPFRLLDKMLLLLSYFVFWEYFVISRQYVLVAFVGLALAAVRTMWPQRLLLAFGLLGVLANTMIRGTIWSLGAGARLTWELTLSRRLRLGGFPFFLFSPPAVLFSFTPPADATLDGSQLHFDPSHLGNL